MAVRGGSDFFERQDVARRRTAVMVLIFVLAVIGVIAAVNAVAWFVVPFLVDEPPSTLREWAASEMAYWVSGITAAAIAVGSIVRWTQLAHGGGGRVAILMGGRIVDPDTRDPLERELINVVEEMSIASGVTVPDVYVLENENGINAFAAGLHPANAVVVFTRGALEQLNRDELQGVTAHEFSHILNGDMRLNLRLLALLAGITVIGEAGASVWRGFFLGGRRRAAFAATPAARDSGRGGRGDPRAMVMLLAVGLALIIIGWIGVTAGRIIKAAVSRQREFLADAAAVQFTRNPEGIGGALLKIAGQKRGSMLAARRAEEISHMGFARTVGALSGLTATHPPVRDRLQAIGVKYAMLHDQQERARKRRERLAQREREANGPAARQGGGPATGPLPDLAADSAPGALGSILSAAALGALAGSAQTDRLDLARALIARMPGEVELALHRPDGARRVVWALLVNDPVQHEALPEHEAAAVNELRRAMETAWPGADGGLAPHVRLPLLELAFPALRRLESEARDYLLATADTLIRADGRLAVFEYAIRTLLIHHLLPSDRAPVGTAGIRGASTDVRVVLSVLCRTVPGGEDAQRQAYAAGLRPLLPAADPEPLARDETGLRAFTAALERLDSLAPTAKRSLLAACVDCVTANGEVSPTEAELLRVIAAVLGAPIPPLDAARD